jgi:glyoxylase-like metal-dependent hydrolase (beta-lactamase superfamily II)
MFKKTFMTYRLCVILLLAAAVASTASAQTHQEKGAPEKGPGNTTFSSQLVKTGLYLISGDSGNTLLRFSAEGLILVNGTLADNYRPLMSQVRKISKISDLPVRGVIITDYHDTHTGTNAKFLAVKAQILAQENVKQNLMAYHPGGVDIPLPTFTYTRDFTMRLGGVQVQLKHFGNAHTSGDTVAYFPDLKVVAVGDLFSPNAPDPDFSGGGSLVDWGTVLDQILKLDFEGAVPNMGPMITRADLEAFKTKLDTVVSRATRLVKQGTPKDQLMAQLKTDDLGWRFSFTGDQLDRFYDELSHPK